MVKNSLGVSNLDSLKKRTRAQLVNFDVADPVAFRKDFEIIILRLNELYVAHLWELRRKQELYTERLRRQLHGGTVEDSDREIADHFGEHVHDALPYD